MIVLAMPKINTNMLKLSNGRFIVGRAMEILTRDTVYSHRVYEETRCNLVDTSKSRASTPR